MSENLRQNITNVALGCCALGGAIFAFSAGEHEVASEYATSDAAVHSEQQQRNADLLKAGLFEAATICGIFAQHQRPRS